MDWLKRMFTLPERYNSLSDIARDPLGAIANAAPVITTLAGLPIGGTFGAALGKAASFFDKVAPFLQAYSLGSYLSAGQSGQRRLLGLAEQQLQGMNEEARRNAEQANRILSLILGLSMAKNLNPALQSAARIAMNRVLAEGSPQLAALARLGAPQGALAAAKMGLYANAVAQAEAQRQAEIVNQLQQRQLQSQFLLGALGSFSPQGVMGAYANSANAYAQLANAMAQQYNVPAMLQGIPEMMKAWGKPPTPTAQKPPLAPTPASSLGLRLPERKSNLQSLLEQSLPNLSLR